MRIKIQTVPPLPPLKAWVGVQAEPTILHLKRTIRTQLDSLRTPAISDTDLLLLLDDFQLLDASPIDVIRDGDRVEYINPLLHPPKFLTLPQGPPSSS